MTPGERDEILRELQTLTSMVENATAQVEPTAIRMLQSAAHKRIDALLEPATRVLDALRLTGSPGLRPVEDLRAAVLAERAMERT